MRSVLLPALLQRCTARSWCCLTGRSTGRIAACRHLARHFILGQLSSRHNAPVSFNVRQHKMQTVPASDCFASTAVFALPAPSDSHGCGRSCQQPANAFSTPVNKSAGPLVIGVGSLAAALRFALQLGHSAFAVRFSRRLEMLASRAKSVRYLRFAPAA